MANIVQVKRGALADVPVLNAGEFGFSTDTHQIFIGDGAANHELAKQTSLHAQGTDTALGAQSENLDMNTHKIVGVVDPTADQEAATKKYVDDNAGGGSTLAEVLTWSTL